MSTGRRTSSSRPRPGRRARWSGCRCSPAERMRTVGLGLPQSGPGLSGCPCRPSGTTGRCRCLLQGSAGLRQPRFAGSAQTSRAGRSRTWGVSVVGVQEGAHCRLTGRRNCFADRMAAESVRSAGESLPGMPGSSGEPGSRITVGPAPGARSWAMPEGRVIAVYGALALAAVLALVAVGGSVLVGVDGEAAISAYLVTNVAIGVSAAPCGFLIARAGRPARSAGCSWVSAVRPC